ncbi:MAG: glycosyltransferase family 2 protein, partial [Solirubrobacteraceae bacterium]
MTLPDDAVASLGKLARALAPEHSRQRRVIREARRAVRIASQDGIPALGRRLLLAVDPSASSLAMLEDRRYRRWLHTREPSPVQLRAMRAENATWSYRPLVSVVVPVYNPEPAWLDDMILSVRAQAYDNWQLCIADDCSPREEVRSALRGWAARDPRIEVTFRTENGNIAAASNSALTLAHGDFIALVDHDDVLRPHALHRVVEALQRDDDIDVLYTDEDKVLLNGRRGAVHLKGPFDPDYLLSTNCIGHLAVLRRSLVESLGGFRAGFDGSQDHDLVLRATERARRVEHVDDVVYSWKQVPGSAALSAGEKPAAWSAGLRAVQAAVERRGGGGHADFGLSAGLYDVRHPVPPGTTVTVAMLSEQADIARHAVRILQAAAGMTGVQWIVGVPATDGASAGDSGVQLIEVASDRGVAAALNRLASASVGDVLVFLHPHLKPRSRERPWLPPLVEQALRADVGAVGAHIIGRDGDTEEEGLHIDAGATVRSVGSRYPVIRRTAAVSDTCLAITRARFVAAGGFEERYAHSLHDADLCMRLRAAGLSIMYTPLAALQRTAPAPRGSAAAADRELFASRWPHDDAPPDP